MRAVPIFLLLQQLSLQKNISACLGTALAHRTQTLEQKWDTAEGLLPSFCLLTAGTTKLPVVLAGLPGAEGGTRSEILASPELIVSLSYKKWLPSSAKLSRVCG